MTRHDMPPVSGLDVQIGLLLSVLDDATQEWRGELGDVSEEVIAWQPFPGGHSIGALLLHIADVEAYWLHEVGAGLTRSPEELSRLLSAETNQDAVQWPTPPARPLSWFLAQQDEIRARTRNAALSFRNPELTRRRGDDEFSVRWLLGHVVSHEAYHGGQAVLLSLLWERR